MLYRFLQFIFFILLKIIYRVEITGKEYIPQKGPFILCSNHQSIIDPVIITANFKIPIHWMAKKELFEHKFFGSFISTLGAFPIDRQGNDIKAIKTAMRYIKNGEVIGIFPEGTRMKEKNYSQIKAGTALIAHRTKASVLPVYIEGNYKIFRKMKIHFRPAIHFDSRVKLTSEEYEGLSQDIMRRIYGDEEIHGNLLG
ncbi:MAG: lysophospholipid acyltransferase family protein [Tissierellia bacterium]|nr:lysophospholipid acyltransferase family protein [Tissierellia bacterium]